MSDELARLAGMLKQEGGLLAAAVREPAAAVGESFRTPPGPRAREHEQRYGLVLEAIREGYLLHYGVPRTLAPEDPDLALLIGDRLYALGLAELVELGDIDAVAELADLISLCATAHAAGDEELAEAAWEASQVVIGWGSDEPLASAQKHARRAPPGAAKRLRSASVERAR